jgi:hypothetical protein
MEWNNYLELDHNQELYNQYLLNMNENLGVNYSYNNDNNNFNFFKKYLPNYKTENFPEENINNNNKIDYYNIINNPIPDLYNIDENSDLSPINNEESEDKKKDKENNKKKLFKTQTFSSITKEESSKNKELSMSDDINNNSNNSNSGFNLIPLPLNERMKLKKEKTKKLLENKKKRSTLEEESKSKENIDNKEGNGINNLDKISLSKLSKKELKMLRNRLSAQRSRDRKKKELIDLKIITKNLLQENQKLRNGIKERDDKINQLMNLLCPECKNKLNGKNQFEISIKENNDTLNNNDKMQLTPSSIIGGKKKLALLMTGLFTIFCVFGTLINPGENNLLRTLKEKGGNKNNTKLNYDGEKRVNVPFLIEKDYTIRHQKEIEMYQKIKKNNLKNKNMMVPASLFTNNSEQIISNINQKVNNNTVNNSTEEKKEENEKKEIKEDNKFLSKGRIKIIEKQYSGNDEVKNEIKMENDVK